jgi:hypothetical protein
LSNTPQIEAHALIVGTSHDDCGAVRAVADGYSRSGAAVGLTRGHRGISARSVAEHLRRCHEVKRAGYLNALRELYHGDYFWATDPFEMDLDEALTQRAG